MIATPPAHPRITSGAGSEPADGPFRLGTRRSPLALVQAKLARDALLEAHGWAEDAVVLVEVTASGDRIQDRALAEVGGKALWTRELDRCLLEDRIDAAVHSAKDVETVRPTAIALAAALPRADVRDVLVGADSLDALPPGARLGTSSPRRSAQVLARRPDLSVVLMRGNVQTRLAKLAAGEADATLLAKAGLDRLGLSVGTPLAIDTLLPAPAQGAVVLECRADDERARAALAAISDRATMAAVRMERAVLDRLGADCRSPVACLAEPDGSATRLRLELLALDGRARIADETRLATGDEAAARAWAAGVLGRAPEAVRVLFAG